MYFGRGGKFLLALTVFFAVTSASAHICKKNPFEATLLDFEAIQTTVSSKDADQIIVSPEMIKGETLQVGQILETKDGETKVITFTHPFPVQFYLESNTKIEITEMPNASCGPKLKQHHGDVTSDGSHPKSDLCDYEIETPSFYLNPIGTRYISSVDLNEALAELNGENTENISVEKGSIEVKLVKISSKSKVKKISYSSTTKSKGSSKTVSKSEKVSKKSQTVALSQIKSKKIKLKAGSKAVAKVKKSKDKKEKIADIEVVDPWNN